MLPALIVRYVQVNLNFWWKKQWQTPVVVPPPDFVELFDKIELQTPWEISIPNHYITTVVPTLPPDFASSGASIMSGLTGTSGVSGSTSGTPLTSQPNTSQISAQLSTLIQSLADSNRTPTPRQPNGTQVRNPAWKEAKFKRFKEKNLRHARLLANVAVRPPICPADPNVEMCLAWHIKGMCNERCGRKADHMAHTDEQDAQLVDWCNTHYKMDNE